MYTAATTPAKAEDLSASGLSPPTIGNPAPLTTSGVIGSITAAAPGGYFLRSPIAAGRMTTVPNIVKAPALAPAMYMSAQAGPSYVAPPRIVSSSAAAPAALPLATLGAAPGAAPTMTVTGLTQAYGAPMMPVRPSFVAPHPTSLAAPPTTFATAPMVATQSDGIAQSVVTYAPAPVSITTQPGIVAGKLSAPPMVTTTSRAAAFSTPTAAPAVSADYVEALEKRLADLEVIHATKTHSAFVFIKPHAVSEEVKKLAKEHLASVGIYIISEGTIMAEEIDNQQLIDTHYGAIAAKAVKESPADLTVQPKVQEEFQSVFGISWAEALDQGSVFNAMQGAEVLGITPSELGQRWGALTKGIDLLKFGGGFYCGKIDDVFIINGFYMDMRGKFTAAGTCIYYYETEWDARQLSWQDFRRKVLGGTDPAAAEPGSLRGLIYSSWEALGLAARPDTGDNGVHASASPFEALAERSNWLGVAIESDFFGRSLLASGIPLSTIQEWCNDPIVSFDSSKQSLFDLLEDLNSRECLQKAAAIASENA